MSGSAGRTADQPSPARCLALAAASAPSTGRSPCGWRPTEDRPILAPKSDESRSPPPARLLLDRRSPDFCAQVPPEVGAPRPALLSPDREIVLLLRPSSTGVGPPRRRGSRPTERPSYFCAQVRPGVGPRRRRGSRATERSSYFCAQVRPGGSPPPARLPRDREVVLLLRPSTTRAGPRRRRGSRATERSSYFCAQVRPGGSPPPARLPRDREVVLLLRPSTTRAGPAAGAAPARQRGRPTFAPKYDQGRSRRRRGSRATERSSYSCAQVRPGQVSAAGAAGRSQEPLA